MSMITKFQLVPGDIIYKAHWRLNTDGMAIELRGTGLARHVQYNYKFVGHFPGPLNVSFMAEVGPALPPPGRKFTYAQTIPVLESDGVLPQFITVHDAKHPLGQKVPISFFEIQDSDSALLNSSGETAPADLQIAQPEKIFVLTGGEFTIEVAYDPEKTELQYNDKMLDLISSGMKGSKIFWIFRAIVPGGSRITVQRGPTVNLGNKKIWDVIALLPWLIPSLPDASSNTDTAVSKAVASQSSNIGGFVSFLESLENASRIVNKIWDGAKLYWVDINGRSPSIGRWTNPYEFTWLTAHFRVPESTKPDKVQLPGRASIRTLGTWSVWGTPEFVPEVVYGPAEMELPLKGGLDWVDAWNLVEEVNPDIGLGGVFKASLYQSLNPKTPSPLNEQPIYQLNCANGRDYAVGSVSRVPVWQNEFKTQAQGQEQPPADAPAPAQQSNGAAPEAPVAGVENLSLKAPAQAPAPVPVPVGVAA